MKLTEAISKAKLHKIACTKTPSLVVFFFYHIPDHQDPSNYHEFKVEVLHNVDQITLKGLAFNQLQTQFEKMGFGLATHSRRLRPIEQFLSLVVSDFIEFCSSGEFLKQKKEMEESNLMRCLEQFMNIGFTAEEIYGKAQLIMVGRIHNE